ncbi:hypothetical protein B0H67DRAFT_557615 [Lasiosphaeris hirsuta]|uniref:Heterokaryon incompatibility domain-containing protein n=1 Tax=Lasiosphaeris hirsuta TaxID=260670 RepID=A0AA40DL85_9PEZI|nr:hypothetical protein B0H67DRAFT_557615 [Lasiosphaeris hirsuta]
MADKTANISDMGSIYGDATLTVVASTNSDPTKGLPGVGRATRSRAQFAGRVQGISLVVAFQDSRRPYTEIESSVLNTRAWTFQERHLSQRSVYFTSAQMHFTCPHGTAFEDTVPVPDANYKPPPVNIQTQLTARIHDLRVRIWSDPTQAHHPNKAITAGGKSMTIMIAEDKSEPDGLSAGPTPIYTYASVPDTEKAGTLQVTGETLWKAYTDAVKNYTKRKLSWHSDVVSAFQGVTDLISQGANTKFWCGIPEFALDRALLWCPQEILKRREYLDGGGEPSRFPSWSWAAWEGNSSYRGRGWYNAITYRPVWTVKWLFREKPEAYIDAFKARGDKTDEEVVEYARKVFSGEILALSRLDSQELMKVGNPKGREDQRDKVRNEHYFTHPVYPGLRFTYPISLPGEEVPERVSPDGALYFVCHAVSAKFCDMPNTPFIQRTIEDDFLQIGLNDESRSANRRRPWQRIIYHQGYRAGFLHLNVEIAHLDLTETSSYCLVAMSREGLATIAPPDLGWDWYWSGKPREVQYTIYHQDWATGEDEENPPLAVPLPDWEKEPITDPQNENGDPHWDEGRFGDIAVFDIYNVLLLRRIGGMRSGWERIGVGKVNLRAFHYGQPSESMIILNK